MARSEDFPELLSLARVGDVRALNRLLTQVQPWLERAAREFDSGPEASTADIVQDAWLRAWQNLDQFRADNLDAFRAWLEQIVRTVGLNAVRRRNALKRLPDGSLVPLDSAAEADSSPTPSHQAMAQEEAERLRQALAAMPDEADREVLRLRFEEGLSLREIAIQLGENHERTRQRFHRVLSILERRMGNGT